MSSNTINVASPASVRRLRAPFRWGVATSAYQIEGANDVDGRTPSIWDTFCQVPGVIDNGDTGDGACDHYHRMPEDVAMMADLGVDTYRFSVSWSRVQPRGRGPANPAGLAFYDRLVDELLGKGIEPWLTLYHWDLPQELEDAGGWPVRDTALRFVDYADMVFEALGDRVDVWTTMNEPWCSAMLGYAWGAHAPGRSDLAAGIQAAHHLLLGHGLATQRLREAATRDITLGITLNLGNTIPATDSAVDAEVVRRADGLGNRLYLDALRRGEYPADVVADLAAEGIALPVQEGDMDIISTPIDALGINYYMDWTHSGVDEEGNERDADGRPVDRLVPRNLPVTAMEWEIDPTGLTVMLTRIAREYPGIPLFVTENGAAFDDFPDADGNVADPERTGYIADHIAAIADAQEQGADVRGYFVWSLMDNFEWAYGYDKRFGLVRVDFDTKVRTPKQSAHWYRDAITAWRSAQD